MPLCIVTETAKQRIATDIRLLGQRLGWSNPKIDRAVLQVEKWPEVWCPPGQLPGGGAMPLECGLVFPLSMTDMVLDNTRGLVAPAAGAAHPLAQVG